MALSISTPPPNYAWLYSPLASVLTDAGVTFKRFLYKVTVSAVDSEIYESLREADNTATLDLSALLKKFFDIGAYPLPDLTDADIELQANQTALIRAYTLTATSQYTSGADDTETATAKVVWGGLSYRRQATDTLLNGASENEYPALTAFLEKATTPTGKEFLNFAAIDPLSSPSTFNLAYICYDEAGDIIDSGTTAVTAILAGKTSQFDVSYSKICTPLTAQKVYSYTVQIQAQQSFSFAYSPVYTFQVNHAYQPQTSQFLYVNSRGGLSTVRLFGERTDEQNATRESVSRYISPLAALPTSANYSRVNMIEESFEIGTGYMESWQEFRQVQDLFLAQGIWEIVGTTLVPVELLTKKLPTYNSNKTEFASSTLEFKYLMSNFDL
jgi:hypothetical protein